MKKMVCNSLLISSQTVALGLAMALATPMVAQTTTDTQNSAPAAKVPAAQEGFWGKVNPFARKKWVHKQTDPINDRLSELDEVNGKNAKDIKDVDARAQAGIRNAQSTADAANQMATDANGVALKAGNAAQGAASHVDQLGNTVSGLDQYKQSSVVEVSFRSGQPVLSASARKQLDELASSLNGRQGYILEIEGHTPSAGVAGIENSKQFTEAVKRYLVTEHQIPVYRLHAVGLGNASDEGKVKSSSVSVKVMENSLAKN